MAGTWFPIFNNAINFKCTFSFHWCMFAIYLIAVLVNNHQRSRLKLHYLALQDIMSSSSTLWVYLVSLAPSGFQKGSFSFLMALVPKLASKIKAPKDKQVSGHSDSGRNFRKWSLGYTTLQFIQLLHVH